MRMEKHGRNWAVYDDDNGGGLICLTAYRKGAREVVRIIEAARLGAGLVMPAAADKPGEYPAEEQLPPRSSADLVVLNNDGTKNPGGAAARECAVRTYLGIW